MSVKWTREGDAYRAESIGYYVRRNPNTQRWEVWPDWATRRAVTSCDTYRQAKAWSESNHATIERLYETDYAAWSLVLLLGAQA